MKTSPESMNGDWFHSQFGILCLSPQISFFVMTTCVVQRPFPKSYPFSGQDYEAELGYLLSL